MSADVDAKPRTRHNRVQAASGIIHAQTLILAAIEEHFINPSFL